MTKLQWCRANAPDALGGCTDEELLDIMSSAYSEVMRLWKSC